MALINPAAFRVDMIVIAHPDDGDEIQEKVEELLRENGIQIRSGPVVYEVSM